MVSATLKKDRYETYIVAGRRKIIADEPADLGGSDRGMSPMDLLCSSLASCVAITLRMYADRKNWPLEEIKVSIDYDGKKHTFVKDVILLGKLNKGQLDRLAEVADLCPVNKILSRSNEIQTLVSLR